jgi:uncharacterized membrane protein HdeD (DUF308 family)
MNKLKNSKVLAALIMIIIAVLVYINPMTIFVISIIIVVVIGLWHILASVIEIIKEDRKL